MSNTTDRDSFEFYRYTPSLAAAVIFVICFSLTTALHSFQMTKTRTWYFTAMIVGGCFECIGYIGRVVSSTQSPDYTLVPFIIQGLLLLVAPALFAASIYMVLGRIVAFVDGEANSPIRKRWLTKIFVFGDCFSFLLQGSGGGLMATVNNYNLGEKLILVGLFVQAIFFGIFIVVTVIFQKRMMRNPTQESTNSGLWLKYLYVLYATSALIMVRSVFRVIEYIMGNDGYILRHEIFLYIFDAVLMLIVMVLFNIFYPSVLTRKSEGSSHKEDVEDNTSSSRVQMSVVDVHGDSKE